MDQGKGNFVARIKFEKVPTFCFLCGIIGPIGAACPQKAELGAAPPRYGEFSLVTDSGDKITEGTLAKRKKRFTWLRAKATRSPPVHGVRTFRVPTSSPVVLSIVPTTIGNSSSMWEDIRRLLVGRVGVQLQSLRLQANTTSSQRVVASPIAINPSDAVMRDSPEAGLLPGSSSLTAKRARLTIEAQTTKDRVEETSPDWSQSTP
ncbi:unnamed protein product [Linum trigynum]|uniref:Zinc knuckle CX2CX4HX4C domain-containing protein n=1 Tax=Linum trigynum TaxID=586398 RepID=A0AAV2F9M6_9ROSI